VSQRRVYTGSHPTVFLTGGVGPVEPGQEFDVPDEHLAAFDARSDVRRVRAAKQGGKKTSSSGDEAASAAPDSGD
jgi:hypothetical protein